MTKIKELLKNEKYFIFILIFITSIVVCIPLMNKNIDMTYDDGVQHICRLIGTYQGFQNGNTSIFENFCNGFGYCWNLFYSPLTAYLPLIFKLFGCGYITCIKLFMFISVLFSGIFMNTLVKKITNNKFIAVISAIFYMTMPYRFTDMYIRNAFAELVSFTFLPLVFLGLYNLFEEEKNIKQIYIPLILGSTALFLTHTVITMYSAIFALIYIIINYKKIKINKSILKTLLISALIILLITSFFWMPLLELKNTADYEVFKEGRMERTEVLVAYKLNFYRLFFNLKTDYMHFDLGLICILGLLLTPIAIKKIKKEKYYKTYMFFLISGIVSCIMSLKVFPFEYLPSILKMIQFSFRMLEFASFFLSIVAAINIVIVCKKFDKKELLIIVISLLILSSFYTIQIRTIDNFDEELLINTIPVTKETGRVHAGCASFEYLPCKAYENMDYIIDRNSSVIVLSGNALIENEKKNNSTMQFDVKDTTQDSLIELPYIFYPEYEITLRYNGQKIKLDSVETENGFVGVNLPEVEYGIVDVQYKGTNIMNISKVLTLIGLISFCGVVTLTKSTF